ncbi:hypothetical protein CEXT_144841 [Caerostris extrusa]|uniref:Uncharacterized protein n=1 Tax=Caerostris extrusa TaxID=172846 RepID=A0AAV4WYE7_CAEEX|nr:hypothetical protein CEXT_144841 [Caerostris extrusa]
MPEDKNHSEQNGEKDFNIPNREVTLLFPFPSLLLRVNSVGIYHNYACCDLLPPTPYKRPNFLFLQKGQGGTVPPPPTEMENRNPNSESFPINKFRGISGNG